MNQLEEVAGQIEIGEWGVGFGVSCIDEKYVTSCISNHLEWFGGTREAYMAVAWEILENCHGCHESWTLSLSRSKLNGLDDLVQVNAVGVIVAHNDHHIWSKYEAVELVKMAAKRL